jgi:hypothetical protein
LGFLAAQKDEKEFIAGANLESRTKKTRAMAARDFICDLCNQNGFYNQCRGGIVCSGWEVLESLSVDREPESFCACSLLLLWLNTSFMASST